VKAGETAAGALEARRVAAIYDVHGNVHALEAVLAELEQERPDLVVFGGDLVDGPFPRETLARARAIGLPALFVRGNGERGLADADEGSRWCAEQLDAEDVDWLAALPLSVLIDVGGLGPVLFCHATPRSDEEIVTDATPDEIAAEAFAGAGAATVVVGHTHVQGDRVIGGGVRIVNAGSVGWPYADGPGAYWALLGDGEIELRRSAYAVEEAARAIATSGWPPAAEFARENVVTVPSAAEATAVFEAQREAAARCTR
jgi:predicted phosphodiesterase